MCACACVCMWVCMWPIATNMRACAASFLPPRGRTREGHLGRTRGAREWAHKGGEGPEPRVGAQGRTRASPGTGRTRPDRRWAHKGAQGRTADGRTRPAQGPARCLCSGLGGESARSRQGTGGRWAHKAARAVGAQGWARTWTSGGRTRRVPGATAGWAHKGWPGRGAQGKDAVGAQRAHKGAQGPLSGLCRRGVFRNQPYMYVGMCLCISVGPYV